MQWHYLLLPVIGAVIGWVTNAVAIKMLFRPYRPVRILGWTFQGLLPRRRKEFAAGIARTVERDLLTTEDVGRFFEELDWEEEVGRAVEEAFQARLGGRLAARLFRTPVLGLVGREVVRLVQRRAARALVQKLNEQRAHLTRKFREAVSLQEVVARKVEALEMEKLEALLMDLISKELAYIELVGAVLGFVIGLAQVVVLAAARS